MEELAIKIAEVLDISVQGAIDIYPVIRSQYMWYEALTTLCVWAVILGFISMLVIGVSGVIRDDTDKYYWNMDKGEWNTEKITEEWDIVDKVFKKAILALLIFIVIGIMTSNIAPFLAPDIMIIKNFLG